MEDSIAQTLLELTNAQSAYRFLGDAIDYGVWICDVHGRCTYASQSFLNLLGHSLDEIRGLGWTGLLHPDDVAETTRLWLECVATGVDWNREHRFLTKEGTYRHVLARGKAIRDPAGSIRAWVGLNLDYEAIKGVEEQLKEATRSKNRLLAAAGHDLKQPLQVILAALDRIPRVNTVKDRKVYIDRAKRAIDRLNSALDSLLAASVLELGGVAPIVESVDMTRIITGLSDSFADDARRKGLRLRLMPCTIAVRTDPDMLFTILSNLVGNAVKFTDRGGVVVGCRRRGAVLWVEVVDTGPGIPPEEVASIFDEFRRVASEPSGFGLGLSIVRRTAQILGVEIKVFSRVGHGSRFVVEIPI